MPSVRLLLNCLALSVVYPAAADTVYLRRTGNATVIAFEYITQDKLTIMVKRQDNDAVLTYKWQELDQEWIKKNNPRIWAERELLIEAEKSGAASSGKDADADPFAQQAATDSKSLIMNLLVSLQEGMKGMSLTTNRVDVVCDEFQLDEGQFWQGFDDLKRASQLSNKLEAAGRAEAAADENRDAAARTKVKGKTGPKTRVRSPESIAAEAEAKKDFETVARPFSALGYLRMLAEGGVKAKPVWMMLRRSPVDREAMKAMFLKYAKEAGELAEKPEGKASKSDLLVIKKALENCADSTSRVTRETTSVEARLQSDCRTLLALALR